MAKIKTLQDYVDLVRASGAEVLGSILWFSITGTVDHNDNGRRVAPVRTTVDQLEKWFDEFGLDKEFIPKAPRKVHAFRTACTETRRVYKLPVDGQTAELMIREVTVDAEKRIHHVMRELKDSRGERLSYTHAATLKYYRSARKGADQTSEYYKATILRGLSQLDEQEVEALIHEFDGRYTDLSANLHSQQIRGMIRNYLVSLNAISVRPSGGIYFVHQSRQETIDALGELIAKLGDGCTFFQNPLPDIQASREMLTDAYQDEVEDDVRDLLAEIAEYNEKMAARGERPSPTKYAEFRNRLDTLVENSTEYTQLLGLKQERASVALEMALAQVDSVAVAMSSPAPVKKTAKKTTPRKAAKK